MLKLLQFWGESGKWREVEKDLKERNEGNFLSWEIQVLHIE